MITLIDAMNIVFIEYSIARKKLEEEGRSFNEENVGFFYHALINKFNVFFSTYRNIIFCWEGKGSTDYRKSLFPGYKENRKQSREEDEYQVIKSTFKKIKEILNFYPCKQISVDGCEGDDVIFALCEKYKEEDRVLVLSSDGDFSQLGNHFENVLVYNPIHRREITPKKNIVIEKSIIGDSSDGIPGLYRIGPKKLEKMLEDKSEWNSVMSKSNNKLLFETFLKVVDLSLFPSEKRKEIQNLEDSLHFNSFDPDSIEGFFWENKLKDLLRRWTQVKNEIYKTLDNKIVEDYDYDIENLLNNKEIF